MQLIGPGPFHPYHPLPSRYEQQPHEARKASTIGKTYRCAGLAFLSLGLFATGMALTLCDKNIREYCDSSVGVPLIACGIFGGIGSWLGVKFIT